MTYDARLWPGSLLLSSIAIGVIAVGNLPVPLPVRTALGLWFVLVCPGMALVRPLRLGNALNDWMLAFAVSVSLGTIVSSAFLYAGAWSWSRTLLVLMAVCIVGALVDLSIAIRERRSVSDLHPNADTL